MDGAHPLYILGLGAWPVASAGWRGMWPLSQRTVTERPDPHLEEQLNKIVLASEKRIQSRIDTRLASLE